MFFDKRGNSLVCFPFFHIYIHLYSKNDSVEFIVNSKVDIEKIHLISQESQFQYVSA